MSLLQECLGSASKPSIIYAHAPVAQWTECLTSNQSVARSSRAGGTLFIGLPQIPCEARPLVCVKGDAINQLRVSPYGGQASRAGGTIFTQIPTNFLGKDRSVIYAFPPTEDRRVAPGAHFLPKFLRFSRKG